MAKDHVSIGPSPCDETSVQVEPSGACVEAMLAECKRFLELTRKKMGEEPDGAWLSVKGFPHEFGTYYEVVCNFYDDNEQAVAYAYRCESEAPRTWDDDKPVEKGILGSRIAQLSPEGGVKPNEKDPGIQVERQPGA